MNRTTLPQTIGVRIRAPTWHRELMTYLCRHGFWPECVDSQSAVLYRQFPDYYLAAEVEPKWRVEWRALVADA
ncbi:MAG: hypothetical protein H7124_09145 [Phycisphaerales bacterium]|nr:hypothetical protein [Hyphomonadaceae bacterium]